MKGPAACRCGVPAVFKKPALYKTLLHAETLIKTIHEPLLV
jgi:hypothetical protein